MASRFQKKSAPKIPSIPGTRASLFNYQLLTSTGVPGLDHLLGGGLPVGTVALLQDIPHQTFEDSGQNYSQLLVQYFLAEGFFHGHKLFHGQTNVGNIQLPAVVSSNNESVNEKQSGMYHLSSNLKPIIKKWLTLNCNAFLYFRQRRRTVEDCMEV